MAFERNRYLLEKDSACSIEYFLACLVTCLLEVAEQDRAVVGIRLPTHVLAC